MWSSKHCVWPLPPKGKKIYPFHVADISDLLLICLMVCFCSIENLTVRLLLDLLFCFLGFLVHLHFLHYPRITKHGFCRGLSTCGILCDPRMFPNAVIQHLIALTFFPRSKCCGLSYFFFKSHLSPTYRCLLTPLFHSLSLEQCHCVLLLCNTLHITKIGRQFPFFSFSFCLGSYPAVLRGHSW